MSADTPATGYRGRLAPSPTGLLHLGHARTFWAAFQRSRQAGGRLILREEDLDRDRCRPEFAAAAIEDLRWFGVDWEEGPDTGGPVGPYRQSERLAAYDITWRRLLELGAIYPCTCSRKDVAGAVAAPHAADDEPVYPGRCRHRPAQPPPTSRHCWRFRVPDGEVIEFDDTRLGPVRFTAGRDFGDFVVRRHDGIPSYQLACVADDHGMRVTEVVRGADLLLSTARQLLLYRALAWTAPAFHHVPLVRDADGRRLAKRDAALSLRRLREEGWTPEALRARPEFIDVGLDPAPGIPHNPAA